MTSWGQYSTCPSRSRNSSHQDQGSASRGVTPERYPRPEEVAEEVVEAEEAKEAKAEMVEGMAEAEAVVVKRHTSTAWMSLTIPITSQMPK